MSRVGLTTTCNITTGKLDANAVEENGIYPFFTCAPEPLTINTYAFEDDVILLAGNNASGNFHCQRYNGKFNAYQRTYVITAKEGYDIDYIYYNLKISLQQLKKKAQGSQTKFLTMKILEDFMIEDLEYSEQKKISKVLARLDKKININIQANKKLFDIAKTLFDYYFLQFEFPNENGNPYKSSSGVFEWNEKLQKNIPTGWKDGVLANFIGSDKGGDWGNDIEEDNYNFQVSCIRGADFPSITGSQPLEAPIRFILERNKGKALEEGDIIIEISGGSPTQSTGRICYINDKLLERFDNPVITSNFCKAFSVKKNNSVYWFYLLWNKLYDSNVFFNYESKTTGIKNLLFEILCNNYPIIVPPDDKIEAFNNKVKPIFEKMQENNKQNEKLISIREYLLPMLMNGQAFI